ncbi:hypothetical protein AAZX31_06G029600 [Glycine max]|uniref:uncharacterized protein PB18E9.04c n=1 Tax=Glycine max TaxID=3847 RepID=UPI00054A1576|nr:uncharacterized protein PB18E9.04c-like [Glycine max]XP_028234791.1 uncharacterized protein PB18E9.04c-like [Glycine soja]KAG4389170.1 hypothetical protein GLYMA_06G031201v4 [Glycine max]KAG5018284.1 hypothetical protein JHK87_014139 [Glycine soja]KAG5044851.1 hypothetical protein JHK86_014257 [Glycine max]KAH1123951.1 hypothetical protein GYH30_013936 [Glycine max]KAH1244330.1 hypothetical protein GmHk_06G014985 [Glycine max]
MLRKKQQCGFRIPWISGPSTTESHSPPPKQKSKSLSTHRPPFRPHGIASTPQQPPPLPPNGTSKTKPQQVSNSLPSHSPAPSVIIDSPVSFQPESPSTPTEPNVKELELDSTPTQNSNGNNMERKMMFATSTPSGKDIKVVPPASASATISLSTNDDISALNPTLNVDDKTVSVVTLAGDNRGVTMHVAGSHSTRPKPEGKKSASTEKDEAGKTYVNSNIQSINNSIMSNGSINGRDPGVRVILPQQPCLEKPKAEVSINRAEMVPYRPVVRRRCLRGLFHEPSDSEPDNPDKPRRHGCKFRCGDIDTKDKETVTK